MANSSCLLPFCIPYTQMRGQLLLAPDHDHGAGFRTAQTPNIERLISNPHKASANRLGTLLGGDQHGNANNSTDHAKRATKCKEFPSNGVRGFMYVSREWTTDGDVALKPACLCTLQTRRASGREWRHRNQRCRRAECLLLRAQWVGFKVFMHELYTIYTWCGVWRPQHQCVRRRCASLAFIRRWRSGNELISKQPRQTHRTNNKTAGRFGFYLFYSLGQLSVECEREEWGIGGATRWDGWWKAFGCWCFSCDLRDDFRMDTMVKV